MDLVDCVVGNDTLPVYLSLSLDHLVVGNDPLPVYLGLSLSHLVVGKDPLSVYLSLSLGNDSLPVDHYQDRDPYKDTPTDVG